MKKSELRDAAGIGQATLTKLNKDETVSMDVLIKICTVLECDIGDIVEIVNND
jgi:DNA-binding Xre family transcriptional regulator